MKIITHANLIEAGCFNIGLSLSVAERALRLFHDGNVIFPDKVSQIFNQDEQTRINCLPATIKPDDVCGMKWVAVFPPNPERFKLPNLNASILLSETTTGYPIAFMDGTLCSNLRTAAVSAIAAKYLAKSKPETIGFLGAGEQAMMHLLAFAHVFPSIKICKVASRKSVSELNFINKISELLPEIEFQPCNGDFEKSARGSEIVVTAISGQVPLLKAKWLEDGVYYNHVGGWEDEYEVPLTMDKIVCDDWNSVKHRTQTISRLYQAGKLTDKDIYADLHEIVSGTKPGRENENEKIYFNPVGLSYVDIALAKAFYDKVSNAQETMEMTFETNSMFDTSITKINR